MTNINSPIRIAAFAIAAILVGGTTHALGSYSNAKFAAAHAATDGNSAAQPTATAIAPSRIDVLGKRSARIAA